jgi:hypothetical protein
MSPLDITLAQRFDVIDRSSMLEAYWDAGEFLRVITDSLADA